MPCHACEDKDPGEVAICDIVKEEPLVKHFDGSFKEGLERTYDVNNNEEEIDIAAMTVIICKHCDHCLAVRGDRVTPLEDLLDSGDDTRQGWELATSTKDRLDINFYSFFCGRVPSFPHQDLPGRPQQPAVPPERASQLRQP